MQGSLYVVHTGLTDSSFYYCYEEGTTALGALTCYEKSKRDILKKVQQ